MIEQNEDKIFITTKEAARLLSIGQNTILELCRSRFDEFPAIKMERKYLINKPLLIEWAKATVIKGEAIIIN